MWVRLLMIKAIPIPPMAGPSAHKPRFSRARMINTVFEIVEWKTEEDVVVMEFGFALKHRPFSFGEGIRGMRLDE